MTSNLDNGGRRAWMLINIIGCLLLLSTPIIFMRPNEAFSWNRNLKHILIILFYLGTFYINFFFLIKRYLWAGRLKAFFIGNGIVVGLSTLTIFLIIMAMMHTEFSHKYPPFPHLLIFCLRDVIYLSMTAALAVAIRMTMAWQQSVREKARMEAEVSKAELRNLKSQLNPHFLFNTLNNIYSLMEIDSQKAQNALLGLSKILRYVLYDNNQELVPLQKEITFMRSYIELMSLRLHSRVKLSVQMPQVEAAVTIAPLLYISLIENAFKHGVSLTEPSFITISFELKEGKLTGRVENSFFPKNEKDLSGSGIGIENLRRRLELLYPGRYEFTAAREGECYRSLLTITL